MRLGLLNMPPVIIKRSQRKTLSIEIKPTNVIVRAPQQLDQATINNWVKSREKWINQHWQSMQCQLIKRPTIEDGGFTYVKGRSYRLLFSDSKPNVVMDKKCIVVNANTKAKALNILKNWYIEQAKVYFRARVDVLSKKLALSTQVKGLSFRKTKTKWGHCSSKGHLQFNWLLMMMPEEVIDYVIVHELCHLIEMNHSKKFWSWVGTICPDYRQHINWLKFNQKKFWLD